MRVRVPPGFPFPSRRFYACTLTGPVTAGTPREFMVMYVTIFYPSYRNTLVPSSLTLPVHRYTSGCCRGRSARGFSVIIAMDGSGCGAGMIHHHRSSGTRILRPSYQPPSNSISGGGTT